MILHAEKSKRFLIAVLLLSSLNIITPLLNAWSMSFETKKAEFINMIPVIAERFIGVSYEYGGDFREAGVVDNSHLFYSIYDEAARRTGLKWKGYLKMKDLMDLSTEIQRKDLRNGDLVFLNNGHAVMVYKFKDHDNFNLIYSSYKRQQVITFHCRNVAFKGYWLKNLKGYYRPADTLLIP